MLSKDRYGPWALIVGGSEGIGEHLARKLAAVGINIILVARKPGPLAETAQKIRDESGVEVRTLQLDIAREDLLERVIEVTDGAEIGMLIHNVGGGASFGPFVEASLEAAMKPVLANAVAVTKLVSHFGGPMAKRKRGGILFIGSLAGNAGSYYVVGYGAAKAYIQNFAEGLWAELQPLGVDVLAFPIGAANTPARIRSGTVDAAEVQVLTPEEVAQQALDNLPHGPVYVAPVSREFFAALSTPSRREAAELQRDLLIRMIPS